MSKLIALEASSDACSVALLIDEKIHALHELTPRSHAQRLLPMIQQLLLEYSLSLRELDAIAFGCGPGSFTGLRIAAGVTQGLAFGSGLPVIAVSSLEMLVAAAHRKGEENALLVPVVDARMDEVYCSAYRLKSGHYSAVSEEFVCKPDALPFIDEIKKAEKLVLLGSGAALLVAALEVDGISVSQVDKELVPHAQDLASIALQKLLTGETLSAEQAIPVYLRGASAWKKSEQQKN